MTYYFQLSHAYTFANTKSDISGRECSSGTEYSSIWNMTSYVNQQTDRSRIEQQAEHTAAICEYDYTVLHRTLTFRHRASSI